MAAVIGGQDRTFWLGWKTRAAHHGVADTRMFARECNANGDVVPNTTTPDAHELLAERDAPQNPWEAAPGWARAELCALSLPEYMDGQDRYKSHCGIWACRKKQYAMFHFYTSATRIS